MMAIDALESFVLDFLTYRRERRETTNIKPISNVVTLDEALNTPEYHSEIGKGWPHYRGMITPSTPSHMAQASSTSNIQNLESSQDLQNLQINDIIPTLSPIVIEMLEAFGAPVCAKTLSHLVNQVLARAIELPPVAESIVTTEMTSWGRIQLLQTVIELLLLLHMDAVYST